MRVLVINCGSSSIKFSLYEIAADETLLLSGRIERIGEPESFTLFREHSTTGKTAEAHQTTAVNDHTAGMKRIVDYLRAKLGSMQSLQAVGHRVVHGGESFQAPTLINSEVMESIRSMVPLAPLHNPANLIGIEAITQLCPQLPQVVVFDTAFFHSLPPHAYRYAVPEVWYEDHKVRRYGFHGISHQFVANAAADHLQKALHELRIITLHLGNGASAAAIRNGVCIDTSMGMTPLEGLVMGTRCGDIDPSLTFYLARNSDMGLNKIETLFNQSSGLKGICGVNDMREVHRLANEGNVQAQLAIDMFCYRICKYIGAYYVALGGLDALIFSAGIGENDSLIQQIICNKLAVLGGSIKQQHTQSNTTGIMDISANNSKVKVLVIPTNEELEIARQTAAFIGPQPRRPSAGK